MALTSLLRPISAAELADLLSPVRTSIYAGDNIVLLRWCERCGQWMREGSAAAGRCVDCGAPRPAHPGYPSTERVVPVRGAE